MAHHDRFSLTKPHRQVLSNFVVRKWRLTTLKCPATVRCFSYRSFNGPPFMTLMIQLDLSHHCYHFSTGLDCYLVAGGTTAAIDSSNIGFKLLKKHGWEEETDLRISEQGMLEPVEAYWKNN
ncbi:G-patch domain containing protein [Parasponia andersonii]|uniref:G-patch domain containing protein n=1 Tax=Parasponia andersonii TaxID=3476 RepID=A0A2P5AVN8_PARAD|nr:G-patch domain containing protein [Parasponia andersonii]